MVFCIGEMQLHLYICSACLPALPVPAGCHVQLLTVRCKHAQGHFPLHCFCMVQKIDNQLDTPKLVTCGSP